MNGLSPTVEIMHLTVFQKVDPSKKKDNTEYNTSRFGFGNFRKLWYSYVSYNPQTSVWIVGSTPFLSVQQQLSAVFQHFIFLRLTG